MPDWLKALIAGFTAKKLGGGCLSTILIFVIVYYALGQCNHAAPAHTTVYPSKEAKSAVVFTKANH